MKNKNIKEVVEENNVANVSINQTKENKENNPQQNQQNIVVYEMKDTTIAEILEQKEIDLSLEEIKGNLVDKLAYVYTDKDGIEISGLTKWGLISCCQNLKGGGFNPVFSEPKIEPLSAEFALLKIEAKNPNTGQTSVGICQFRIGQRFSERIAETIAKRRAIENLLPISIQQAYIQFLKKKNPKKILQIKNNFKSVKDIQKQSGNIVDDKTKAIRMLFAVIHEKGVDIEKPKSYVKNSMQIEHFSDISIDELKNLYKIYKNMTTEELKQKINQEVK